MAPTQGDAPPPTGPGPNTGYGLVPEDELDYEESTGGSPSRMSEVSAPRSPEQRQLRTPNPFPERPSPLRSLYGGSALSSREEGEIPEANIITNPLDEAQGQQLEQQRGASRSNIPEARPLVSNSQRDYSFRPRDPAVVARESAQQLLTTYVIGPTPDQVCAPTQLREQYLTLQRTTPSEYAQRLSDQSNNLSVPDMRRIPVVFRPGELSHEEDAQFQNWVEHSRKLSSLVALRASFSKQDVLLERRLRFRYAKRKVNDLLRSHRSRFHGATGSRDTPRSSSRTRSDTSSTRSSTGKREQTDESVEGATAASGAPDQKRPRRQGSLAGAALHTPMTEACPAISPDTGYDLGAAGASTIAPSGSGAPHADPATPEGANPPLDSRYATADCVHAVEREFAQHRGFRNWVAGQLSRFADDLEQAEHYVDEVADQAWKSTAVHGPSCLLLYEALQDCEPLGRSSAGSD
ncbi:Hypothetical protein PHPALM_2002 [Phytophthora palmivora]|uniref:Uncharacterized protein n=1 Tax=Phytophthora palmivora TaxID=4796 RepID=A0A2P4YQU4_9STRA|nr:Hypothetical protein PHPALM_2002 [Phytophthora palmivora]